MKIQKIAIVGAGISGLYLSWKLAKKGHLVTVFEKKQRIGKKACSGLFSERIFEFIPQSRKLIQNRINSAVIHFPKRTIKIEFSKKFFVMSHYELDNLTYRLAERSGTQIILAKPVTSLSALLNPSAKDLGWLENFDRIVGCDGPASIIRRGLKLKEPDYRLAIQGFVSREDYSNNVETWPIKKGFVWKIPRGKNIEYGIIGDPHEIKEIFEDFLRKNNIRLGKWESGVVPQGLLIPENSSVTLCGDAAGLTKPWSGGGVIWALTAADLLLKNFSDFLKYKKDVEKLFMYKINLSKIATEIFYFLGFNVPWILPKKRKVESDFLF